ncbi:hypothetical protein [Streptomyces sp. NPDC001492]
MSEISGSDAQAYRLRLDVVESPVRAAPYAGPLAWTDGRMYDGGFYGEVTVRVHDAGQLGTVRREVAERLAPNWGVSARRFEEDVWFSRQGGRYCGDERRVARHGLKITGDPLRVARFAADLPGVLALIERAATAMMRTLGRWVRDSARGQEWADLHDARHQRVERRWWRRSYMRHLARWIGPEAVDVSGAEMPDWSDDWLNLTTRIAQATAHTVDITVARDHMSEALLYAKAVRPEPRPVEPAEEPGSRYATVHEAIHAPVERNDEIGDVEFCVGEPADEQDAAVLVEDQVPATVGELTGPEVFPPLTARRAGPRRARSGAPAAPVRIVARRPAYGSIGTRPHRRRPPHRPRAGSTHPPATTATRSTPRRKARTH